MREPTKDFSTARYKLAIAELDAISLYEQLSETTENKAIVEVLLDVAKEEKTHMASSRLYH